MKLDFPRDCHFIYVVVILSSRQEGLFGPFGVRVLVFSYIPSPTLPASVVEAGYREEGRPAVVLAKEGERSSILSSCVACASDSGWRNFEKISRKNSKKSKHSFSCFTIHRPCTTRYLPCGAHDYFDTSKRID